MKDSAKKVVVTGAGGHLGYNLVQLLVANGYQVRATVRDLHSPVSRLLRAMNVELFKADVMQPDTLVKAFQGCDGLFHLAAVYQLYSENPMEEIVRPAVEGVQNMMQAARKAGIKKVIMTSSIAAVGTCEKEDVKLDERTYNDGAVDPYFYAKTQSEKIAWQQSAKLGIKLVTICPGMILGGGFFKHTPSTKMVDKLLFSKLPMVIPGRQNFVDVRDVAQAHLIAFERDEAEGRYLATCDSMSMGELAKAIKKLRPRVMRPLFAIPGFLVKLAGPLDKLNAIFLGEDRYYGDELIKETGNKYQNYDNSKLKSLGWQPRAAEDTLRDTIEWIESHPYLYA